MRHSSSTLTTTTFPFTVTPGEAKPSHVATYPIWLIQGGGWIHVLCIEYGVLVVSCYLQLILPLLKKLDRVFAHDRSIIHHQGMHQRQTTRNSASVITLLLLHSSSANERW